MNEEAQGDSNGTELAELKREQADNFILHRSVNIQQQSPLSSLRVLFALSASFHRM
jgi:hypothetical protein